MSDYNTLRLVRNLRKERDRKIVYDRSATSWKEIFKLHPLKSGKNESHFHDMEHCKEYFGSGNILSLRTNYTWGLLKKIAYHSLDDCRTFYDVAVHTMLNKEGILNNAIHEWFKSALTAIYLSHKKASESLNYLSEMNQEQKEKALSFAFQHFGAAALEKQKSIGKDLNVEHFNEKLVLWLWNIDGRQGNLVNKAIDELSLNKKTDYDFEYIAENIQPNNLTKYVTATINENYLPFEKIKVLTERYKCDEIARVCLLDKQQQYVTLDILFNLFVSQQLLKGLHKGMVNNASSGQQYKVPFADGRQYTDIVPIIADFPISRESVESMTVFIEKNKADSLDNKDTIGQVFWKQVDSCLQNAVLNFTLNDNLDVNKKQPKKPKI